MQKKTLSDKGLFDRYFSKVVVINLPQKTDRKTRLTSEIEIGNFSTNPVWIKAYSGDKLLHPGWWNAGNGAWGCLLSHAHAIQEAIMEDQESLLILEDDVIFQPSAGEMVDEFMGSLPSDWDQLYLGGQHLIAPLYISTDRRVLKGRNINRTHAYALSRKCFSRFLNHILNFPDYMNNPQGWHLDHQIGVAHEQNEWSVYAPPFWIAGQGSDWSSISGKFNPDMWWHHARYASSLPFVEIPQNVGESFDFDRRLLHAGNNLKPESFEDIGLDSCVDDEGRLQQWLDMIAKEAIDMQCFPAWNHENIPLTKVQQMWPAGTISLDQAKAASYYGFLRNAQNECHFFDYL